MTIRDLDESAEPPYESAMTTISFTGEAHLRDRAADRYPDVPVGQWLNAASVASEHLALARKQDTLLNPTRILADADWEFRGGAPEAVVCSDRPRTRWSDHPGPLQRDRGRLGSRPRRTSPPRR